MATARPWRNLTSMIRGGRKANVPPKKPESPPEQRDPLAAVYRFIIMQSREEWRLYQSIVEGFLNIEQTAALMLNDAFSRFMPGGTVMLFVYIEGTEYMCGVMELLSQGTIVTTEMSDDESGLMFRFQINWLEVKDAPIGLIEDAGAPGLDESSFVRGPLKEITTQQGLELYFSYVVFPRSTSLLERCAFCDDEPEPESEVESEEESQ
ncbi:hypothetical protein M514_02572 [Trichuris suis]|uniref:YTH domain-containing protein n=1 Tax=Trichuris suis TaxID=68888 RepID=A0A085NNE8_9BILA|nr:hypothetical protein M513_02572 [Trichuris suis]KFD70994.1 hypothetical protein M514_02572 [Trichuris suis]